LDQRIKDKEPAYKNRKTGANPVFLIKPTAIKTKNKYIYIMKGINGGPNTTDIGISPVNDINTKVPSGYPGKIVFTPPGGPPGPPIQYGDSIINNTVEIGFGYLVTGGVKQTFVTFSGQS
jgi:hypothetical protein